MKIRNRAPTLVLGSVNDMRIVEFYSILSIFDTGPLRAPNLRCFTLIQVSVFNAS